MKRMIHPRPTIVSLRMIKYGFLLFLLSSSLSSCFQQFYQTNTAIHTDSSILEKLRAEHKMFIIHTADSVFVLKNPAVNNEILSGNMDSLRHGYRKHLSPFADTTNKIGPHQRSMVLNEVHLYTNTVTQKNEKINMEIGQIYRMDVYGLDKRSTGIRVSIAEVLVLIVKIIAVGASGIHTYGNY
jgi:hypothetical protein